MHVFVVVQTQSATGHAVEESRRRGCRRVSSRSPSAWPKRYWEDLSVPFFYLLCHKLLSEAHDTAVTARTTEIDAIRFQDKDLEVVGTLEYGQFGVVSLF